MECRLTKHLNISTNYCPAMIKFCVLNKKAIRSTAAGGSAGTAPRRSSLRLWAQNNQENTEPSSSPSYTGRRSLRSRRTMPARMLDSDDESDTPRKKERKNQEYFS